MKIINDNLCANVIGTVSTTFIDCEKYISFPKSPLV